MAVLPWLFTAVCGYASVCVCVCGVCVCVWERERECVWVYSAYVELYNTSMKKTLSWLAYSLTYMMSLADTANGRLCVFVGLCGHFLHASTEVNHCETYFLSLWVSHLPYNLIRNT